MPNSKVVEVLRRDEWSAVEGKSDTAPFLLRFRTPVLAPPDTKGFDHLLTIVWPYAEENTGAMPTPYDSDQMKEFEDRFCDAVEHDAVAILTAVLTFDGSRQWVFYTGNVDACGERLSEMPQNEEPYPIELATERDPKWKYLREGILKAVPKDA